MEQYAVYDPTQFMDSSLLSSPPLVSTLPSEDCNEKRKTTPFIKNQPGSQPLPILPVPTPYHYSAISIDGSVIEQGQREDLQMQQRLSPDSVNQSDRLAMPNTACATSNIIDSAERKANKHETKELGDELEADYWPHQIEGNSSWVEHTFYPDTNLSWVLPLDRILRSKAWDAHNNRFYRTLTDLTEGSVAGFLNYICSTFSREVPDLSRGRVWRSLNSNSAPIGSLHSRKPDGTLKRRGYTKMLLKSPRKRTRWAQVIAHFEVTNASSKRNTYLSRSLLEKGYIIFETQPTRRFVLALAFYGPIEAIEFTITLLDRSGIVYTTNYPLDGHGYCTLARVMYALTFAPLEQLGLDPNIQLDENTGDITAVSILPPEIPDANDSASPASISSNAVPSPSNQSSPVTCHFKFTPILRVFRSPKLLGRGTHVWITKEKATDEYMVWKDSWLLEGRENVEYRHLEVIRSYFIQHGQDNEVKRFSLHLPILKVGLCGLDSTKMHRTFLPDTLSSRSLTRLFTKPVADPLTSFCTKREFLDVMADIVEGELLLYFSYLQH